MLIFSSSNTSIEQEFSNFALIYLGFEIYDPLQIDDVFLTWSQSNIVPPTILVLGHERIMECILDYSVQSKHVFDRLKRLSRIVFAGFNSSGEIHDLERPEKNLTKVIHSAINSMIEQNIEQDEVVIPAPPGFYFEKLSGHFSSHFIRTESLLQSTHHIELLAIRILQPFNTWFKKLRPTNSEVVRIYIDTMSIWPIAEKLIQIHGYQNGLTERYVIESFKSYDGFANWFPPPLPCFVIISASTSGSLETKVKQKLRSKDIDICTILSLKNLEGLPKNSLNPSIFPIPRTLKGAPALNGLRSTFETDLKLIPLGCETINIVGERFLNQSVKPKRVRLVHISLNDQLKEALRNIALSDAICVGSGKFDARSRWALSFDYKKLFDLCGVNTNQNETPSVFKSWLRNYASPGPIVVIYPSSSGTSAQQVVTAAKELASKTQLVLRELMPGVTVDIISSEELTTSSVRTVKEESSVVVVAPIVGNGFTFKQISAQLRLLQSKGPRLFIALAALPETQNHFNQLKTDITLDADDRLYQFKCKFVVPIGKLDTSMQFDEELEILDSLTASVPSDKQDQNFLSILERANSIRGLLPLSEKCVFLPSAQGKPLNLSGGFLLWPDSTQVHGDKYQGAVLLTISALLEASRAASSKNDVSSLKTGLFQHALICPQSFTRFNDSVIQAAILRAAYPSELNYSISKDTSYEMERFILKWIEYRNQPVGYALPEFLLALGTRKLKLCDEHTRNVLKQASLINGWIGQLANVVMLKLGIKRDI